MKQNGNNWKSRGGKELCLKVTQVLKRAEWGRSYLLTQELEEADLKEVQEGGKKEKDPS